MSGPNPENTGWFADLDPDDLDAAATAISEGEADQPRNWPAKAVQSGFANDEGEYYGALHEASVHATREAVRARESSDERQLQYGVAAMDDAERISNELTERVLEWGGSRFEGLPDGEEGLEHVAASDPQTPADERLRSLARLALDLEEEAEELRSAIERQAPSVAPNLAEMAGPVLAARLISLAGGLESLAKKPSGTVQLLGAEDALFAHLSGRAPSPKHGVIFTHEYVRGTHPDDRGSASRAFAGKLAIAARIDHYSGDYRPEIHEELRRRIETIRSRKGGAGDVKDEDAGEDAAPGGGSA